MSSDVSITQIEPNLLAGSRLHTLDLNQIEKHKTFSRSKLRAQEKFQNVFVDKLIDVSGTPSSVILSEFGLENIKDIPLIVLLFPQKFDKYTSPGS